MLEPPAAVGYNHSTLLRRIDSTPRKGEYMLRKAKKNAQGAGTIRKRSDGRWEARYTIDFAPATGKQKQKSIYGKT